MPLPCVRLGSLMLAVAVAGVIFAGLRQGPVGAVVFLTRMSDEVG
jgi:hypothetical protein